MCAGSVQDGIPDEISVGDVSVHDDGVNEFFFRHGYSDATGKLWWDQQDGMERHEELLAIEKFKPTSDPILLLGIGVLCALNFNSPSRVIKIFLSKFVNISGHAFCI